LKDLSIEDRLLEIVDMQNEYWSKDFPHLKEMKNEIIEILNVEVEKFEETLKRGERIVRRLIESLKTSGYSVFPKDKLIELYDSNGLPPEIVKDLSSKYSLKVEIPQDFYATVAERHIQSQTATKDEAVRILEEKVKGLPETKKLYYDDRYLKEFEAKALEIIDNKYVVLDATAFYPEGGGQPPDR
ncbi:MAG: alanine--tRNA ligase-related protein, partial [Candidatus Bathyarchaeia archaeon]